MIDICRLSVDQGLPWSVTNPQSTPSGQIHSYTVQTGNRNFVPGNVSQNPEQMGELEPEKVPWVAAYVGKRWLWLANGQALH